MDKSEKLLIEMAQEIDLLYDFVERADDLAFRYAGCEILMNEYPTLKGEIESRRGSGNGKET